MIKKLIKKITPSFVINGYHLALAWLGAILYRFPSRRLKVIGVTGTNGKSTVVHLTKQVLEEAGLKVASVSSIKFTVGREERINTLKMTMPGRFKLQKFLREALSSGCQYVVIEVTSEGIKQHRHRLIDFDVAVLTNLSPEHIEAHGGFQNYKKTKGELFRATKGVHVINIEDESAEFFLQFPAKEKYTYGLEQGKINNKDLKLNLQLVGDFNIYNSLAAICVGLSQEVSLKTSQNAVERIEGIPGRMETVIEKPFRVIVDYAVTPESLKKLYKAIKRNFSPRRLIAVLGSCGGGRDNWKRPVLGKIAGKHCDEVIITNEDPYDENPMKIIKEVYSGCPQKGRKILDRRKAIREALRIANSKDIVVITGKGCEPWMYIKGNKRVPWDDREIVRQEFKSLNLE